jgi:rod shape determining protein RodA
MLARAFDLLARRIDTLLMAALCITLLLGLAVVYSATGAGSFDRVLIQLRNFGVALVALWIVANIPPQQLMRLAVPIYLVGVVLLVAVAVAGDVRNGARRWLNLGFTSIQPSEAMKIAVPMALAWYFHKHEAILGWRQYLVAGVILALPTVLIMRQPDLGTAILIAASGCFVIFLAGISWRVLITLSVLGAASLPLAWSYLLHDYQRRRVLTMLDPSQDPLGAGYHINQAAIAIGSGGLLGKGWLSGTQSQLDFIPERHTDFILAVFGEEFGLLGVLILLLLYGLIIGRGLLIAFKAQSTFSRLVAGAVTLMFFTYAFVNMGMVTGLLPVVGVPLPLVSYGGTALLTMMIGFGILMSVAAHKQLVAT